MSVVLLTQLRVAEDPVGFVNLLGLVLVCLDVLVLGGLKEKRYGMMVPDEFPVGSFDLFERGGWRKAQHSVIIHKYLPIRF